MRRVALLSALMISLSAACGGSDSTAPSASAAPSSGIPDEMGELVFQHLGVRLQAPVSIKSAPEVPNAADTSGKRYKATLSLGTVVDPLDVLLMNDPIVIPKDADAIQKDSRNTQIEKLPNGAVAYLRGDEPTVWLAVPGKDSVTCALASKKTPKAVELAWKICKTLRLNDG